MLIDLANRYKDRLQIVGVSVDEEDPQDVKKFAEHFGINYPIVMASPKSSRSTAESRRSPLCSWSTPMEKSVQKHQGLYAPELYETEVRLLLGLPANAQVQTFEDQGQIFLKNAALATECQMLTSPADARDEEGRAEDV